MIKFILETSFGCYYFSGIPENAFTWDWNTPDIDHATSFNTVDYPKLMEYLYLHNFKPIWGIS